MDYIKILENLKNYYANLLIIQYNGKPKAVATIKMLVELIVAKLLILQVRDAFDWTKAKGEQLDFIGKWVGISRTYQGSLFWGSTFFSYPEASQLIPTDSTDSLQYGFSTYETFNENEGGTLTYDNLGFVENSLSDDDYRIIIGLKIIKNSINHTCKNIDDAIWEYFDHTVYTTWQPHEIIYHYPSDMTTILEVCNNKGALLAPTGVRITLREI